MLPALASLRSRFVWNRLRPNSRLARTAYLLAAIDLFLYCLKKLLAIFHSAYGTALGGWIGLLTLVLMILGAVLAYRWTKSKLLWRLRNRLIVTYVFIGVIPAVLLVAIGFISLYLFAGQFANFVVTSELHARLRSLHQVNAAIAGELAERIKNGEKPVADSLHGLKAENPDWAADEVCAWLNGKPLPFCAGPGSAAPFSAQDIPDLRAGSIVRDHEHLYLRAVASVTISNLHLLVISSEPLDGKLLDQIAHGLGDITLYSWGFEADSVGISSSGEGSSGRTPEVKSKGGADYVLHPAILAGTLPAPANYFDRQIAFGTPLPVLDWQTGKPDEISSGLRVRTRPSLLYTRLFAAMGEFAKGVEYALLFVLAIFAIIVLIALFIGVRLTRTVTGAIAQLYNATVRVNRGDLSHRIPVRSKDQLAALAISFNSMTASLENLLEEQREKQKLENELVIAQEVQAQLFPQAYSQVNSLEVHGFCRPARTVSGDYYDFLTVDSETLILAIGDVSGKGISAALLMATIHSAVRAYSLEGIPLVREMLAVGAPDRIVSPSQVQGAEVSPSTLLALLNHQLYKSTPAEKYATLFLGFYDGRHRRLTYSNGGHLPPLILAADGSIRRLDCGGTVVGLFDERSYDEAFEDLRKGEILVAYSDGVTEPENDFGEFGEQRLVELVWEHRHQPLSRITETVTAAVDDWIGAKEQPDDITLVLARAQ